MLLPHCSQNKEIQVIWAKYMDIIGDLKLDFTSEEGILELQSNIKSWFEHFLKVYQAKTATPYMHALLCHKDEAWTRLIEIADNPVTTEKVDTFALQAITSVNKRHH